MMLSKDIEEEVINRESFKRKLANKLICITKLSEKLIHIELE